VREIEHERDIEELRKVARLLERANDKLARENARLRAKLAGDHPRILELELRFAQEQLVARNRALFGPSSEKRSRSGAQDSSHRKPQTGHGPQEQPELPIVEEIHELDEADQMCPKCGGALSEMAGQHEEADEIDVIERSYRIVRRKRKKYRCHCGECVETALGPPKLMAGGRYSVDFAIHVAIAKYADHLPLARQVKQMARAELRVTSQTLWDQLVALEAHLEPTVDALHAHVLEAPVVGADETSWRVMGKGKSKNWWAWAVSREDAISYRILPTRSSDAARAVLTAYEGTVLCDGYSAYTALEKALANARDGPRITLAHCWAHVRRKFVEAEPHYPEAAEALTRIGELYGVEREVREASASEETLAHREALRRERSKPIVQVLYLWMLEQRALPRSALGKAIAYTASCWEGLTRFLDNPLIPLDNNATERGMRAVAVGRKNHYGSRSLHGTRVAASFYSLIESAKMVGVEPAAYLREATHRALRQPGTVTLPIDFLSQ
jgi:transposase